MWDSVLPDAARSRFARQLGIDESAAGRWITFLAAMHHLGKASPAFQLQQERVRLRLVISGWPLPRVVPREPHGKITAFVLKDVLTGLFVPMRVGVVYTPEGIVGAVRRWSRPARRTAARHA